MAEKRRVAPGWLDREEKILEPRRGGTGAEVALGAVKVPSDSIMDRHDEQRPEEARRDEGGADPAGDQLDRAFGGMGLRGG